MDHPHVASLTDVYESEEQLFLVMDTWQGKVFWISRVDVDIESLLMGGEFPMPLENTSNQECMQGGELFDRSWPCKLVPSDFLCFVFFLVFFHIFFSMFLLYAVPTSLTEAWFPADSAILRSGAKETLHGKGCCSSHLSGNHILNPSFSLLLGDGGSVIFFVFVSPFWKLSFLKIRCSFGCLWICRCCWPSTTSTPMILWLDLKPQWKLDGLIDMSSCDHLIIVQLVTRDLKWQLRCTVTSSWRTSCMKRRHAVWFISSFPCSSCFFLGGISGASSWGLTLPCFALPLPALRHFSCRTLIIWSWLILVSATWLSPENVEVVDARATRVSPFHDVSGKIWHPNTTMAVSCGTLAYVAPEVLEKSYTSQCYPAVFFFQVKLLAGMKLGILENSSPNLRWFMEPWSGGIRATFWSLGGIFCHRKCSRSCCAFRNELNEAICPSLALNPNRSVTSRTEMIRNCISTANASRQLYMTTSQWGVRNCRRETLPKNLSES